MLRLKGLLSHVRILGFIRQLLECFELGVTYSGFNSQMDTLAVLWKTDFGRGKGRGRELVKKLFWSSG